MFVDLFLHQHIFLHAQWDKINVINMFSYELDADNVIGMTQADLIEE